MRRQRYEVCLPVDERCGAYGGGQRWCVKQRLPAHDVHFDGAAEFRNDPMPLALAWDLAMERSGAEPFRVSARLT